jgi:hypothetical protein
MLCTRNTEDTFAASADTVAKWKHERYPTRSEDSRNRLSGRKQLLKGGQKICPFLRQESFFCEEQLDIPELTEPVFTGYIARIRCPMAKGPRGGDYFSRPFKISRYSSSLFLSE